MSEARRLLPDPVSINAPLGEDAGEVGDLLEDGGATPFDMAAAAEQQVGLEAALGTLSSREQHVTSVFIRSWQRMGPPFSREHKREALPGSPAR